MPFGWLAAATIGSGLIGADAAKSAANTQLQGTREGLSLQKDIFNTVNAQQAPGRAAGYQSFNQIRSMLPGQYTQYDEKGNPIGTATGTDYLTHQFSPEDFRNQMDPGYQWRLQQGEEAAKRMRNQVGGLMGGNAFAGLEDYTQGLASTEYGNAFNRYQTQRGNIYNTLANIAGLGQTSQQQANTAAGNFANSATGLITGGAAAQAAGQVGAANALSGGLQGAGSSYALSQMLKNPAGGAMTTAQAAPFMEYSNYAMGGPSVGSWQNGAFTPG